MQSLYFCREINAAIVMYVPEYIKFLMYFDNDVVQVDLDGSYLTDLETAKAHALDLAREVGLDPRFIKPKNFTASTLPDIPVNFDIMCCPRSISDLSSKIGLGHIGPKVRRIINSARFPVLIPSSLFKPWESILVFFGGSVNAVKALRLGLRLSQDTGKPLDLFTQSINGRKKESLEERIAEAGLEKAVKARLRQWYFFESGNFEHNLYAVPHNALTVMGAYGHGVVRDILFGSTMETIQTHLPNTMLVAGPNYVVPH